MVSPSLSSLHIAELQATVAHVLSASKFTELSENANHFSDFSELESLAEAGKQAQAAEPLKASDNITEKAGARPENAAKPVEGAEEEVDVTEESFSPQVERVIGLVTFCCVVVIIMLTIFFDFGREKLIESTESTPLNPVVHSLFGELAILGFIALLSFMATSAMVCPRTWPHVRCRSRQWSVGRPTVRQR